MKENNSRSAYKATIIELIPKERSRAISTKELTDHTGLSIRQLKALISELRVDYPICSQQENGGGYWIAESERDILEFVSLIIARRNSHNRTIEIMSYHAFDEIE